MPQPKFSDFSDFLPTPELRPPRPITHLPVNAISAENDPTLEIRTLIEQLQQTSREARTQARMALEEKQALRLQLSEAAAQIETLRTSERALRAHFTEITAVLQERDEAGRQVAALQREAAEGEEMRLSLAREAQEAIRERDEARRERDEARQEAETKLRASQPHREETGESKLLALRQARDAAHAANSDLNHRLETLAAQLSEGQEEEENRRAALAQAEAAGADFRERLETAEHARATALEQCDALKLALEAAQQAKPATEGPLSAGSEELRTTTDRLERQRLESIDLASQLQMAQLEVRELSASLAEARLQVKFANAASRAARHGPDKPIEFASLDLPFTTPEPPPLPATVEAPEERAARETLGAMRDAYQAFSRQPGDFPQLRALHRHAHDFAEGARASGYVALHRLGVSFSELTQGLHEIPELVNASTLRTVQQTLEFFTLLLKERHLETLRDPAKARIYAVDDDEGNCESIELALGASMLRVTSALGPGAALRTLAESDYDLILLDVNLPEMSGFELCRRIRALERHTATPIVFLTALATLENRLQSSQCGGNEFLAKPFNLSELTVKTLTLILKAQLQLA